MKRLLIASALLLAALPAARAGDAPPPLERLLPADAFAAVLVDDPGRLRSKLSSKLKSLHAIAGPLLDREEGDQDLEARFREETGLDPKALAEALQGRVAVGVTDLHPPAKGDDEWHWEGLLLAETGRAPALEKVLAQALEHLRATAGEGRQWTEQIEESEGRTLHRVRKLRDGKVQHDFSWALSKGLWVLAYSNDPEKASKERLLKTLAAVDAGGAAPPLSDAPGFRKARGRLEGADAMLYLNLEACVSKLGKSLIEDEFGTEGGKDPVALLHALGLDALQSAWVSVDTTPAHVSADLGLSFRERRGVLKLLAFTPGTCPRPAFLPADAQSLFAARFSLKACCEAYIEVFKAMDPQTADMMAVAKEAFGMDLEKALASLGDEVAWSYSLAPGDKVDLLYGLSVSDKKALETCLESLHSPVWQGKDAAKRDYLGITVRTWEENIHLAVTDTQALGAVGKSEQMDAALRALLKPGDSPWERPEVRKALEALPPKPCALFYDDFDRMLPLIPETVPLPPGMHWGKVAGAAYMDEGSFSVRVGRLPR